jgi:hypothetical protein
LFVVGCLLKNINIDNQQLTTSNKQPKNASRPAIELPALSEETNGNP